ncbi:DegV family protein [Staphylococcus condimenti]|uniref:DegV family protein n=1 Tax=Staphylococcus condimenti TaxID=70255 RepID=A0A143P958_9STAP|nr:MULTISPECIES: DegV family protein [Staphylococcus]AMY04783.1 fatty acid-binding protein DegV [Staphylococcus condimenti]APR61026.1 fatty acid-binding protein DegV [Staphylococcus condimenti]MDK8644055.1 DegV family protein [Staphylococcus condimenti]OFP01373.1 fatty acid-binding protein DegV [Staphylococcus sp. HMSC065E08]PNZ65419.1 DegV family protein [Staphylococcus condimenti]
MSKKIVTDSTSDLPQEYLKEHDIHVVPLNLTIDGESYIDQIDVSSEEVIRLIEDDADIKTSQPPIGKFIELYDELGKDGSEIISIHMTSGLSGTYQTAYQASQMTDSNVTVIDSKSISYGLGAQLEHIVEWIDEGFSTEEIVEKVEQLQSNIKVYVVIGQLTQLIKGGRIGKAKGMIGNLMRLKPTGSLEDGRINLMHNPRTQKASLQFIKKDLMKFLENHSLKKVGLTHANALDFVEKAKEQFVNGDNPPEYMVNFTTPVISTHTGQGALGLTFLRS